LLPNFVNLLSAGISVPGGGIGISGLEDFYRNAKLKPEQLERYRTALQQMRTMNIMMSQYAKGSVSNYEQGLFGEASINEKDLPGTILLKSEALRARAQFDKSVAELLRKNDKLTVESVKDLPAYQQAEARLNERYRNLILKKPEFFKDPTFLDAAKRNDPSLIGSMDRVPSSSGARPNTPLTDQLRQRSQSRGF
jgi:tetratricopeptide (TPR) repeat protein